MKLNLCNLLCAGLLLLLSGCEGASDVKQKQHDLFPFPCISDSGRIAYVDKDGEYLQELYELLISLHLPKSYRPGLFQDDLIRIDSHNEDYERICLFADKDGNVVLNMLDVMARVFPGENTDYTRCTDFSHGIAFISNDWLHSYAINKKGEVVFEFDGTPQSAFNKKGQAYFKDISGHYGIISSTGKTLYEPNQNVFPYSNATWGDYPMPVEDAVILRAEDGGFILTSYDGKPLSAITKKPFVPDNNGCSITQGRGGIYSIIDKEGNTLCRIDCDIIHNDGKLYWYQSITRNEVGWIDKDGNIKIGPLKRAENQSKYSRIDWFPNMFYGSAYSVGTKTEEWDNNFEFFGGFFSPKKLNYMAEEGYYFSNISDSHFNDNLNWGAIILTPVVDGRYIAVSAITGYAHVFKIGKDPLKTSVQ